MRRPWRQWAVVLCVLVCAAPVMAYQAPPPSAIQAGVRCYETLNYSCAINRLKKVAKTLESGTLNLSDAHRLMVYEHLAFALASVGEHTQAQAAFVRCVTIQADYRLDPSVISPKIYGDYVAAKKTVLRSQLHTTLRDAPLPPLTEPTLAERDVFVLIEPQDGVRTLSPHGTQVELGTMLLFGADAEAYLPGFGFSVTYAYTLMDGLEVQGVTQFFQHAYAKDDLKEGHAGTLYVLDVGAGLGTRLRLNERVSMGLGLRAGLSMVGIASIQDSQGAFVAVPLSVDVSVFEGFAIGLSAMPMLTIGQDQYGNSAQSIGLPLFARFQLAF